MGRSGWDSAPESHGRAVIYPHAPPDGGSPRVKVLIADDDRLVRAIVADLLAELGHDVVEAENGADAVALSRAEAPDLLILDFLMPKLSGLDALRAMREAGVGAPAVLLTGISDGSLRDVDGADAVAALLEKPITRRGLARALARATRPG